MSQSYRVLKKQEYYNGEYKLVPIRYKDRYKIMQWRNEQMYHLRQAESLSKEKQDIYFENTVANLFNQEQPNQILFSFVKDDECIGYGGLVHINWIDKNAEISFIMQTDLEKEHFKEYWGIFLLLIEKVGFKELKLHKLFVFAFDLRPHLYDALKNNDYFLDATLTDHCFFNGAYLDVVIYSKIVTL